MSNTIRDNVMRMNLYASLAAVLTGVVIAFSYLLANFNPVRTTVFRDPSSPIVVSRAASNHSINARCSLLVCHALPSVLFSTCLAAKLCSALAYPLIKEHLPAKSTVSCLLAAFVVIHSLFTVDRDIAGVRAILSVRRKLCLETDTTDRTRNDLRAWRDALVVALCRAVQSVAFRSLTYFDNKHGTADTAITTQGRGTHVGILSVKDCQYSWGIGTDAYVSTGNYSVQALPYYTRGVSC